MAAVHLAVKTSVAGVLSQDPSTAHRVLAAKAEDVLLRML